MGYKEDVVMKILFVSCHAPYRNVGDAGSKTIYYYANKFKEAGHDISILALATGEEAEKLSKETVYSNCITINLNTEFRGKLNRKIKSLLLSPLQRYDNPMMQSILVYCYLKKLKKLKVKGYIPDILILEFTETVMMAAEIKRIYPSAKIVASEHDVSFLRYMRYYQNALDKKKVKAEKEYLKVKEKELESLSVCDLICTHNGKDASLLIKNGVNTNKITSISPYYDDYSDVIWKHTEKWIVFFGAMNRPENYESAIWFMDHIMPKLKDRNIMFWVIGNKPPKDLQERESSNIHITGFLTDKELRKVLTQCSIMVAPLLSGAGIKVKILEMMSAGIPVITNHIGIEGIFATNKVEYIHAETSEDYIREIENSMMQIDQLSEISKNAKKFIKTNYHLEVSSRLYLNQIQSLLAGDVM